jgi:DNA-binding XRE family transcriptional regulator
MADAPTKAERRAFPVRLRANAVDRHVGAKVRERRVMLGLTQQQMAELLGVSYQQTHKYERGINRITAGLLHAVARALDVEVGYFFEGVGQAGDAPGPGPGQRGCSNSPGTSSPCPARSRRPCAGSRASSRTPRASDPPSSPAAPAPRPAATPPSAGTSRVPRRRTEHGSAQA